MKISLSLSLPLFFCRENSKNADGFAQHSNNLDFFVLNLFSGISMKSPSIEIDSHRYVCCHAKKHGNGPTNQIDTLAQDETNATEHVRINTFTVALIDFNVLNEL